MRVALVHDWLTGMRGGERVLEALLELFPDAEIFTLLHVPGSVSAAIEARPIRTSSLDRVPGRDRLYRYLLPLMPRAIETLDVGGVDLVISSSHCVAKGVRAPPSVPHVCYCHTPMRYVWDQYEAYFGPDRAALPVRLAMRAAVDGLRRWDRESAARVDHFIANSRHVQARIRRVYGREARVVHPPVDLGRFRPSTERDDQYVVLGAQAPYKRADLAIDAFNRMGKRLVVVGGGAARGRLSRRAGSTVEVLGRLTDDEVAALLGGCRALVHPGVEDFGIGMVEALASGAPVVARDEGGALDILDEATNGAGTPRGTGVFVREPTVDALVDAVERFERMHFDPREVARSASRFDRPRFAAAMRDEIDRVLDAWPRRLDGTARP